MGFTQVLKNFGKSNSELQGKSKTMSKGSMPNELVIEQKELEK